MSTLGALLMILAGAALMAYGLFIFYAWLPILYGLLGFEVGALIGNWITGDVGWLAIILGVIGAILLGGASYLLEPFRRILLGVAAGFMLGLGIANVLGIASSLGGLVGIILAAVFGYAGGIAVPRVFDRIVVALSALGGAAMIMNGANYLFPGVALFDRAAGGLLPSLLALALALIGVSWQMKNIASWIAGSRPVANQKPGD
jgi:hypothetical protein